MSFYIKLNNTPIKGNKQNIFNVRYYPKNEETKQV